jgi:hypothetical protein
MGHFYDENKYTVCPHCEIGIDDEKTVSGLTSQLVNRDAVQNLVDFGPAAPDDEKTVGIYKKKEWDPVTGWLVCVSGPEKGRDYRLHSGRNFLGRAPQMDISIADDMEISRENHLSVVYEPKKRIYLLVPGSANIYLNGKNITKVTSLKTGNTIGAGRSEFIFIPFCKEGRDWS